MDTIRAPRLPVTAEGISRRAALRGFGGSGVATALALGAPRSMQAGETVSA